MNADQSEETTPFDDRVFVEKPKPENGRVQVPVTETGLQLTSLDQVFRVSRLIKQSGLAPASYRNEQQICVALLRAIELGLPPLQALEGLSVINNRVGIMGDLALAMVESSGQLQQKRVEYSGEGDSLACTITLQRRGKEPQTYSFSVKEARAAGIYERSSVWRAYPRRMTYYRALGFALRDEFSDVLKGLKTVEELSDYPPEKQAQVFEAENTNDTRPNRPLSDNKIGTAETAR